jgi:hypothetical protein
MHTALLIIEREVQVKVQVVPHRLPYASPMKSVELVPALLSDLRRSGPMPSAPDGN